MTNYKPKARPRTSKIWLLSKEEFENIVKKHVCLSDILREIGICPHGHNQETLKKRIEEDNIDSAHILSARESRRRWCINNVNSKYSLDEILVENSTYGTNSLKKRLIKDGLLENKCYECGLSSSWNNKPITLQLDHINGDSYDHRLENLRILCPNCHTQTTTFSGRNSKKDPIKIKNQLLNKRRCDCGNLCFIDALQCKACANKKLEKIIWPEISTLNQMIKEEKSVSAVAKKLGVSFNAVKKHLLKSKIQRP